MANSKYSLWYNGYYYKIKVRGWFGWASWLSNTVFDEDDWVTTNEQEALDMIAKLTQRDEQKKEKERQRALKVALENKPYVRVDTNQ
jgi:hypothetical protein